MKALIVGYFKTDPLLLDFYKDYGNVMASNGYCVLRYELAKLHDGADFGRRRSTRVNKSTWLKELCLFSLRRLGSKESLTLAEMQAMSKSWITCFQTHLELRRFNRHFKECLIDNKIKHVLLNHQFSGYHMIARQICEELSISFAYWHPGFLPGTMSFDYTGQLAESELHKELLKDGLERRPEWIQLGREYIERTNSEHYARPGKSNTSDSATLQAVKSKRTYSKVILIAGSNDYRTGVMPRSYEKSNLHSMHYKSSDQLFKDVVSEASEGTYVIYKPHPNLYPNRSGFEETSNCSMIVFDVTIRDLLKAVDLSISICSSSAYEAQIAGVPAIVVGNLPGINLGFFCAVNGKKRALSVAMSHSRTEAELREQRHLFFNFVGYCLFEYFFQHGESGCPLAKRGLNEAIRGLIANS
jgi:hypothetical protein